MVDYKKTLMGTVFFFAGWVIMLITGYITNDTNGLLALSDWDTTLKSVIWFGIIIVWTVCMLVVPLGMITWGITDKDESSEGIIQVLGVVAGILYGLFALALAYYTWYWTVPMTAVLQDTLQTALFWIGYILMWVANIVVVPYISIIEAKAK